MIHIWISKSIFGFGNSFLDQQIHNWISKPTFFPHCMIQVVDHKHLDPGHSHSYNAARHAGDHTHIVNWSSNGSTVRACKKSVWHWHYDLHTGYPASFCSASNDCNEKSGFDHYNQWPTSKVFMFTFLIVLGVLSWLRQNLCSVVWLAEKLGRRQDRSTSGWFGSSDVGKFKKRRITLTFPSRDSRKEDTRLLSDTNKENQHTIPSLPHTPQLGTISNPQVENLPTRQPSATVPENILAPTPDSQQTTVIKSMPKPDTSATLT